MTLNGEGRTVAAVNGAVCCDFGNGSAILDLESNTYYSLNTVGAFVWDLIQRPRSVDDIRAAVVSRYDVSPSTCGEDIESLLQSLECAGLIEIGNGEFI